MVNQRLPWAAYWAFMSDYLIIWDKQPVIRPVGIKENCCQLFATCVMKVMGPEATHACKDDRLCTVVKAGIDGAVHWFQSFWYAKSIK